MSFKQLDLPDQLRGDSWGFRFIIVDKNDAPISIVGNEYRFTLKSSVTLADSEAELRVGPIVPNPAGALIGLLEFSVSSENTENLNPGTYRYDLQEVKNTGEVSTLLLGKVSVKADVTRTTDFLGVPPVVNNSISGAIIYSGETSSQDVYRLSQDGQLGSRFILTENSAIAFSAFVVGKDTVTSESCAFYFEGAAERDLDTSTVIGVIGKIIYGQENPLFDVDVLVDDTTDSLEVEVTPASANNTRWVSRINYTEVSY